MATTVFITLPNDQPHKVDAITQTLDGSEIERIIIDPGESFPLIMNSDTTTGTALQVVIRERSD